MCRKLVMERSRPKLKVVKYVHSFYLLIHSLSSVKFVTDLTEENYKNMKVEIMSQLFCRPSKMLHGPSIVRVPLETTAILQALYSSMHSTLS